MDRADEQADSPPPGSISSLVDGLRAWDQQAVEQLRKRYFQPLVQIARQRLSGVRGGPLSGEDVALEAFLTFCDQVGRPDSAQRFPDLQNRQNVWRLLVCFTLRHAFDHAKKVQRQAAVLKGESGFGDGGLAVISHVEPAEDFGLAVRELLDRLPTEEYRTLACQRMEGRTVAEIARRTGRSVATVERRLKIIRAVWDDHRPAGEGR